MNLFATLVIELSCKHLFTQNLCSFCDLRLVWTLYFHITVKQNIVIRGIWWCVAVRIWFVFALLKERNQLLLVQICCLSIHWLTFHQILCLFGRKKDVWLCQESWLLPKCHKAFFIFLILEKMFFFITIWLLSSAFDW